jgi:hypothetical protein
MSPVPAILPGINWTDTQTPDVVRLRVDRWIFHYIYNKRYFVHREFIFYTLGGEQICPPPVFTDAMH